LTILLAWAVLQSIAEKNLVWQRRFVRPSASLVVTLMSATINAIVQQLRRLEQLEPDAVRGVALLVEDAIAVREQNEARTLGARLRREHPSCQAAFIKQSPVFGLRRWQCEACRAIVMLPEGR
jgi:hypothetical protein